MVIFNLASFMLGQNRRDQEEAGLVNEAVIAIVTNIADPRKLARVRLSYPSLGMVDESDWTPVVMSGAGKDRGWFTLPEVGDEVLVMFEHGNMDRPIVIGALWNGKDAAPDKNAGKNERGAFVSKSGSRVVLDDAAKTITIEDGNGRGKLCISETQVTLEAAEGDTTFQAGGEVAILAAKIDIKAVEVQFVSGGGGTKATGANITIKGSTVNIKGSQVDFQCGGVPTADKASGTVTEVDDGGGRGSGGGGGGAGGNSSPGGNGGGGGPTPGSTPGGGGGSGGEQPGPPPVVPPRQEIPDQHAITISVLDALDRPAIGIYYELTLPDGGLRTGTTDGAGQIKVSNIEKAGDCTLVFPDVDAQAPEGGSHP